MRVLLLLSCTIVLAACASAPRGSDGGERKTPIALDPRAALWTIREPGMRRTQRLHVVSQLVTQTDTLVREDSLESILDVAWSDVPGSTQARLAGMVTGFAVRVAPDSILQTPAAVGLPFSFTAERVPGAMPTITIPSDSTCSNTQLAALHGWRELWLQLPDRLSPGTTWQDSTRYRVCRDGIPLDIDARRTFTVEGLSDRAGEAVLTVTRVTRQTLQGAGRQFGEAVRIHGDGEGSLQLILSLQGGVILEATGESTLRLELEGRRRQQRLVQSSRVTITAP